MSTTVKEGVSKDNNSKTVEKIPQSAKKGKTAKQIMNRHINDINDVITEEEFKNLEVGVEAGTDTIQTPLEISSDEERPKDEDKDPKITTPWDVIK